MFELVGLVYAGLYTLICASALSTRYNGLLVHRPSVFRRAPGLLQSYKLPLT